MTRPSNAELRDIGRRARQQSPRGSHHGFRPGTDRPDPLDVLAAQDVGRVPGLLPLRYGRMSASPFAFFRGQAAVMASDLATTPATGIDTQLCGDAHLANFGTFATPDGRVLFGINDFDETLPGPFEWDLKRLGASIAVAARHRDLRASAGVTAVQAAMDTYRDAMRDLADADVMAVWSANVDRIGLIRTVDEEVARGQTPPRVAIATRALFDRAVPHTSAHTAERLTEVVDGRIQLREDPPALSGAVLPIDRRSLAAAFLARYRQSLPDHGQRLLSRFEVVDVARRVVGIGNLGGRSFVILLHGRDEEDPLILQVTEAGPSVLEAHLPPSPHRRSGRRVVEGHRLLQPTGEVLLGSLTAVGPDGVERDLHVRRFQVPDTGVDLDSISAEGLVAYARLCGWLLANAHARGGEPATIAGYLGTSDRFTEALTAFATDYAALNEQDHDRLLSAIATGRIVADRPG